MSCFFLSVSLLGGVFFLRKYIPRLFLNVFFFELPSRGLLHGLHGLEHVRPVLHPLTLLVTLLVQVPLGLRGVLLRIF